MAMQSFPPPEGEEWAQALPYAYFVSYAIVGTVPGFGNVEIFRDRPIESMRDVEDVRRGIERNLPAGASACVLNFQLLRGPRES